MTEDIPEHIQAEDWPAQEWLDHIAEKGGIKITAKSGDEYRVFVEHRQEIEQ